MFFTAVKVCIVFVPVIGINVRRHYGPEESRFSASGNDQV